MNWDYLKPTPLYHKGARFELPATLSPYQSFFVPSLKHKETFAEITRYYSRYSYPLIWAERIEEGVLGIRVWCTP